VYTLDAAGSLISEDTKSKVDKGVYNTLAFSLLFKIGNPNKWVRDM